jgi:hypothetical protein
MKSSFQRIFQQKRMLKKELDRRLQIRNNLNQDRLLPFGLMNELHSRPLS